jgi:cyclopropane-fatty-acyl-phospholipid synthase
MLGSENMRRAAVWGLGKLLEELGRPPLRLELWDGSGAGPSREQAVATVHLHDPGACARLLYDPELEFGDLYTEGRLHVEGDLIELLRAAMRAKPQLGMVWKLMPRRLVEGVLKNDQRSARETVHRHYDLGNDFYELWLDERMVYTCAYFRDPSDTLEDAQLAKMDHVCRKLGLRPGEEVIEAGCGWGSLALHMAGRYGVRVRAYNVSKEQIRYAREQAEKQGLEERVEFIEADYRDIKGGCDAFVSVGMLEHVGRTQYVELGALIDRCLAPTGRGLLHTIGRARPERMNRWMERRIFPNAYAPSLCEILAVLEPNGFVALDVENLRQHYAKTGEHWLARFERSADRVEERYGPEFVRRWRLYLASVVSGFDAGALQLFQVVFSRSANNAIPWTRAQVYQER